MKIGKWSGAQVRHSLTYFLTPILKSAPLTLSLRGGGFYHRLPAVASLLDHRLEALEAHATFVDETF